MPLVLHRFHDVLLSLAFPQNSVHDLKNQKSCVCSSFLNTEENLEGALTNGPYDNVCRVGQINLSKCPIEGRTFPEYTSLAQILIFASLGLLS